MSFTSSRSRNVNFKTPLDASSSLHIAAGIGAVFYLLPVRGDYIEAGECGYLLCRILGKKTDCAGYTVTD